MNFSQAEITKHGKTVTEKHSNELWLRYSYDTSEEWSRVTLLKGRKKMQPMCNFNLNTAYLNLVWYKICTKTLSSFFSKAAIWCLSPFATQPFNYPGTQIAKSFIHKHLHSWQSHLKQNSTFLIHGKGIWWSSDECCYMFKDGADDQRF